jgi:sterol desaturase/sphingolipid hydroxylase (fatty acid hydroxylase superfamily)
LLFIVNGAPLVAVDLIFHTRWFPPAMLIFVGYVIVMEDIHYRIHTDLWVPFNLGVKHHHGHHTMPPKNFNVFIPLFDYLLGTKE